MRRIIVVITHLLFVSVLCVAQTQDNKGSALFQEVFSNTQDIEKTEQILNAIYQHEEIYDIETLSTDDWIGMQRYTTGLEAKLARSKNEDDKSILKEKIEYIKSRYIALDTFLERIYKSK